MPRRPEGSPAEVPETKRQFREKVLLLILDKLVFGLLIVIAAFALNWVLERNRADTAFQNEIAKLRVSRIAAVWADLNAQAELTNRFTDLTLRGHCTSGRYDPRPLERTRRRFDTGKAHLERTLTANRFWLGDDLFVELQGYADRQSRMSNQFDAFRRQSEELVKTVIRNVEAMKRPRRRGPFGIPLPPPERALPVSILLTKGLHTQRDVDQFDLLVTRLEGDLPSIRSYLCHRSTPAERRLIRAELRRLQSARQDVGQVVDRLTD